MHRLFVALRPPPDICRLLLGLMDGIVGARWQDEDQLHLTLRFVGEVETPVAEELAIHLSNIRHPPVTIALAGVGWFDAGPRGSVWAGIAADKGLKALHERVDGACRRAGLPPDGRAFVPHVTLARLPRRAGPTDAFRARHAGLSSAPFTIAAMQLYRSSLGSEGARYEAIARYPLAG